jgi:hypothetical protein
MLTALERLSQSKIFGWGCFVVALFLLLTAPLVIYNFSESVKGVGWARWPFLTFGLSMRVLWIYVFFNRWLAFRKSSSKTDIAATMDGNR